MIAKSHRWQKTALAAAAAALFGLWGSNAAALSLGRVTIQSALGEPLRAEIDVPEINAEEAASLKASVAQPDAFRAAGLEYNPAMTGLQVSLQRRPDGRAYIRLNSDRAINDPFVDMILEVNWATGRIVRDYTMLFDPPSLKQAAATPTPAQVPALPPVSKAALPAPTPTAKPVPAAEPAKVTAKTAPPPARPPLVKEVVTQAEQVTVKVGDTASKIATLAKPANVSLDQMLVALLRANPSAFIGDNINRIKSGAIMNIPTAEQADAVPAAQATQLIVAQSKDFNDFRRKLAAAAPSVKVAVAERKASGSVQTKVEDKKSTAPTPDKLTLSKGAIQGQPAEDKLAKERSAKEAANRAAEIAKNISDLGKLGAASSAVAPSPVASAVVQANSGLAVVANVAPAPMPTPSEPVVPPIPASSAPLVAASAPASSPAPAASAAPQRPVPVPVLPPPEPSFVDALLENPLVPAGAAGLIALLAGFGVYRFRQRKKASQVDSTFLESHLQPDSFFGGSGGQSVDTHDGSPIGTSMVYAPSQLDSADDVDPVAEADVYLAYGRDLQAEEILKDAMRVNPLRIAIHQKLLEIYAKRRDIKAFENIATQSFKVSDGTGPEWERICELGLSIDPGNSLYQPGGQPLAPEAPKTLDLASGSDSEPTQPIEIPPEKPVEMDLDLDLNLDFSLDEEAPSAISATSESHTASEIEPELLDLDFGSATQVLEPYVAPQTEDIASELKLPVQEPAEIDLPTPAVELEGLELEIPDSPEPFEIELPTPDSEAEPEQDLSMLEFDLGNLSLDLNDTPAAPPTSAKAAPEDPLGTKLALAEEFKAIGDDDGARALIEEVIAEATGDMKIKAQRALSNL